jgi:hypothetical protein
MGGVLIDQIQPSQALGDEVCTPGLAQHAQIPQRFVSGRSFRSAGPRGDGPLVGRERPTQSALDAGVHSALAQQLHLELAGMHVEVDLVGRHAHVGHGDRLATDRHQRAIRLDDGKAQHAIDHWPVVHQHDHARATGAVIAARGAHTRDVHHRLAVIAFERGRRQRDQVVRGVGAEDGHGGVAQDAVASGAQGLSAIDQHAELHIGKGERQRRHALQAG